MMKTFILIAALATVALCQSNDTTTIVPGNSSEATNSSTIAPVTTTVIVPTTGNGTEPSSNSTTPAPTTASKPTTVVTTNSTEPAGNSTTPAPTSKPTTPAATTKPTTPAATTPAPSKDTVNVTVSNANNTAICISMQAKMSLLIVDGNVTRVVDVPAGVQPSGNCSLNATTQSLELKFNNDWMLQFIFSKDSNDDVTISEIDITYNVSPTEVEAATTKTVKGNFLKSGSDGNYYLCNSNTTLVELPTVTLTATDLKYKAFNEDKDASFSKTATECSADEDTSSVVPIAVGAALAGLVVIVLIAYLIGRRRSRQSGYESV